MKNFRKSTWFESISIRSSYSLLMAQAERLDVVWTPEVAYSDLFITVSGDDVSVVRRHGLKDRIRRQVPSLNC